MPDVRHPYSKWGRVTIVRVDPDLRTNAPLARQDGHRLRCLAYIDIRPRKLAVAVAH